jgi:hypothetical protein
MLIFSIHGSIASFRSFFLLIYIYICVCVCVCGWRESEFVSNFQISATLEQTKNGMVPRTSPGSHVSCDDDQARMCGRLAMGKSGLVDMYHATSRDRDREAERWQEGASETALVMSASGQNGSQKFATINKAATAM